MGARVERGRLAIVVAMVLDRSSTSLLRQPERHIRGHGSGTSVAGAAGDARSTGFDPEVNTESLARSIVDNPGWRSEFVRVRSANACGIGFDGIRHRLHDTGRGQETMRLQAWVSRAKDLQVAPE